MKNARAAKIISLVKRPAPAKGFTLLEVLIAVIVFSIGLLGIASLQMAGLRYTHASQLRSVATLQAQTIADKMYANGPSVYGDDKNYDASGGMPGSYGMDCDVVACSTAELADFDLVNWNQDNANLLPGGDGIVCLDATPDDGVSGDWQCDGNGDVYAIKVQWTDRAVTAEDEEDNTGSGTVTKRLVMRLVP